jgi:lipopolysaccharide export system protein LptA
MAANDNSKVVTFTGRVIARQDDLIITCETMKVHYKPRAALKAESSAPKAAPEAATGAATEVGASPPSPPLPPTTEADSQPFSGGQEIERVECEGAVKIQQGDRLAVGQKAVYLAHSQPRRLILTGDARVWQGRNAVTGHEVTYFLDENRSQVESQNNSRVRAFYDQGPKKGQKK